jgi:protein TonB
LRKHQSFQVIVLCTGILLSLFIHIGVYLGALHLPTPVRFLPSLPIEVVYSPPPPSSKKQSFVNDPDLGVLEKEITDRSRFLSKFNRRVKEESIARLNGPSQNRPPGHPFARNFRDESKKTETSKLQKTHLKDWKDLKPQGDLLIRKDSRPLDLTPRSAEGGISSSRTLAFGGSTNGEYIPNVREGEFTSLNTDQFLYYTFFSRVNDQVRSRWVNAMSEYSSTLNASDLSKLALIPRITVVEVLLQSDGYLKNILINKDSGSKGLDQTAILAFSILFF